VLTLDWLAERLATDLDDHGVTAEVVYGSHNAVHAKPGPRVVVGLAPGFRFESPEGPFTPGIADLGDGHGARQLFCRWQEFTVWVREAPAEEAPDEERSLSAQRRCAALTHEVAAGLRRILAESLHKDFSGEWADPGAADLTYGAIVILQGSVGIPVLDQKYPKLAPVPADATTTTIAGFPGGVEYEAAKTEPAH
jgi:hypothetical protein